MHIQSEYIQTTMKSANQMVRTNTNKIAEFSKVILGCMIMNNNISQQDLIYSLTGQRVYKVCLEPWACGFSTNEVCVYIEAEWILYDSENKIIDQYQNDLIHRNEFHLWKILHSDILQVEIDYKQSTNVKFSFSNSLSLLLMGNDDGLEDYSFQWFNNKNMSIVCNQNLD